MKAPYTLVFGREPLEAIPRNVQKDEVLNAFREEPITACKTKKPHIFI